MYVPLFHYMSQVYLAPLPIEPIYDDFLHTIVVPVYQYFANTDQKSVITYYPKDLFDKCHNTNKSLLLNDDFTNAMHDLELRNDGNQVLKTIIDACKKMNISETPLQGNILQSNII